MCFPTLRMIVFQNKTSYKNKKKRKKCDHKYIEDITLKDPWTMSMIVQNCIVFVCGLCVQLWEPRFCVLRHCGLRQQGPSSLCQTCAWSLRRQEGPVWGRRWSGWFFVCCCCLFAMKGWGGGGLFVLCFVCVGGGGAVGGINKINLHQGFSDYKWVSHSNIKYSVWYGKCWLIRQCVQQIFLFLFSFSHLFVVSDVCKVLFCIT